VSEALTTDAHELAPEGEAAAAAAVVGLAPVQVRGAMLLAAGLGVAKVAQHLGVDRRTVCRWRTDPTFTLVFHSELTAHAQLLRESLQARVLAVADRALDVVETALQAGGPSALQAARIVLGRVEHSDVEQAGAPPAQVTPTPPLSPEQRVRLIQNARAIREARTHGQNAR
jgi:hypothetical protein